MKHGIYIAVMSLAFSSAVFAKETKKDCSQEKTDSEKIKCIVTELADPSHGGTRTDGHVLTVWMADILKPGLYCLPTKQPFKLWRETANEDLNIHFHSAASGQETRFIWETGKYLLPWPQLIPEDQSLYTLTLNDETQNQWRFLHIPNTEKSPEARIIWMYVHGCHEQIPRLIEQL